MNSKEEIQKKWNEAVDLMKTAKTVREWNSLRERVKKMFGIQYEEDMLVTNPDALALSPLGYIDGSGLISKIIPYTSSRSKKQ